MRKPTKALVAILLCGAVSVDADVVRTRGGATGSATAVTPGITTVTGCQNRVLYGDNSSVLNCEAALGYTASTDTLSVGGTVTTGTVTCGGATSALSFGDADSGICNAGAAATNVGIQINGSELFRCSTGASCQFTSSLSMAANPIQFTDVGLIRQAAGVLRVSNASTAVRGLLGGGTAVASATAMPLPTGNVFHVTGTTTITSITSTNFAAGVCITLIFDGILTFTDGSNLVLAGNFTTSADDTISLCYDGTNWYETARSVN